MEKLKLGILGCSDIAYRRFLPALKKSPYFEYVGVASRDVAKTKPFVEAFGGKGYNGYDEIINDPSIDVLYIPLPPALHGEWGKKALRQGKHIFMEKPFTTSLKESKELIQIAKEYELAIFENYMFKYHSQLASIKKIVEEIGEVRAYRIGFGFPMRQSNDFRYNKELGGGALLDCGGYTVKLATELLGEDAKIVCSNLVTNSEFNVDLYGTLTMQNNKGITAQLMFGMDNTYKCEVEVWGSKQSILATRIFTAGDGFKPSVIISTSSGSETIQLDADDQFLNSINEFYRCIVNSTHRSNIYNEIELQAHYIEQIKKG